MIKTYARYKCVSHPHISTQINLPYVAFTVATITTQLYYERNVLFARMATRFNLVSFDVVATALAVVRDTTRVNWRDTRTTPSFQSRLVVRHFTRLRFRHAISGELNPRWRAHQDIAPRHFCFSRAKKEGGGSDPPDSIALATPSSFAADLNFHRRESEIRLHFRCGFSCIRGSYEN